MHKMFGGIKAVHGLRHRTSQMKFFGGSKFRKLASNAAANATWRYARTNRMSK